QNMGTLTYSISAVNPSGTNNTQTYYGLYEMAILPGALIPSVDAGAGEDLIFIYIDSDYNQETGLTLGGVVGADHIVVIKGQDRRITSSELFVYSGGAWSPIGEVEAASAGSSLEAQIPYGLMGIDAGSPVRTYFAVVDWKMRFDQAGPVDLGWAAMHKVTNQGSNTATISFITDASTTSSVRMWGPGGYDQTRANEIASPSTSHSVTFSGLNSNAVYSYEIQVGGVWYSNGGVPWTVSSFPDDGEPLPSYIVYGEAANPLNITGVLVYAYVSEGARESLPLSTVTGAEGAFSLNLGEARNNDGTPFGTNWASYVVNFRFVKSTTQFDPTPLGAWHSTPLTGSSPQPKSASTQPTKTTLGTLLSYPTKVTYSEPIEGQYLGRFTIRETKPIGPMPVPMSIGYVPSDIMLSSVSDASFTVSWITSESYSGSIIYGAAPSELNNEASAPAGETHHVVVSGLQTTTYYYKIKSNSIVYGDDGAGGASTSGSAWSVVLPADDFPPTSHVIYGTVNAIGGGAASAAIVYVKTTDGKWHSASSEGGAFMLNIGSSQTTGNVEYRVQGASKGLYPLAGTQTYSLQGSPDDMGGIQLLSPWADVGGETYADPVGDAGNSAIDFISATVAVDGQVLFVYFDVDGTPFDATLVNGGATYRILVDADKNANTGYYIDANGHLPGGMRLHGMGADHLIELWGFDGNLETASIYSHSGSQDNWAGFALQETNALSASINGTTGTVLVQLDLNSFGLGSDMLLLLNAVDNSSAGGYPLNEDYFDYLIPSLGQGVMQAVQSSAAAAPISSGSDQPLINLVLTERGTAPITSITVEAHPYMTYAGAVEVALYQGAALLTTDTLSSGTATLSHAFSSGTYTIRVNVASSPGDTVALYVSSMAGAEYSIATTSLPNAYIESASAEIVVDGLFDDWGAGVGDGDDGIIASGDILFFDASSENDMIGFYVSTKEAMGRGIKIPVYQAFNALYTPVSPVDDEPPVIIDKTATSFYWYGSPFSIFIDAEITDNVALNVKQVEVTSSDVSGINTGIYPMAWVGGDEYRAELGSAGGVGIIAYTISASDASDNWESVSGTITITTEPVGPGPGVGVPPTVIDSTDLELYVGMITIRAEIFDPLGIAATDLSYKAPGGTYQSKGPATDVVGNIYEWTFEETSIGKVEYIISADDNDSPANTGFASGTRNVYNPLLPYIVHEPVATAMVGITIPISATVTGANTVWLNYTGVSSGFQSVEMTLDGGEYKATIPAQASSGEVTYIIAAQNANGWVETYTYYEFYKITITPPSAGIVVPETNADLLYIFIDTDSSTSTGTEILGLGVDYYAEIWSHDGAILSATLYKYDLATNSWTDPATISAAISGTKLEAGALFTDLGISPGAELKVAYQLDSWNGEQDTTASAEVQTQAPTHYVSNLAETGFVISWASDGNFNGTVVVDGIGTFDDVRGAATSDTVHYIEIDGLVAGTSYVYRIYSGSTLKDSGSVTTSDLQFPPNSHIAYGELVGEGVGDHTIAYVRVNGVLATALIEGSGTFALNIGRAAPTNGQELKFWLQGGTRGYVEGATVVSASPQDLGSYSLGLSQDMQPLSAPSRLRLDIGDFDRNLGPNPVPFSINTSTPNNIIITNLGDDRFTVTFTTTTNQTSKVYWAASNYAVLGLWNETSGGANQAHKFDITGLVETTEYFFLIDVGGILYRMADDGTAIENATGTEAAWSITTEANTNNPPASHVIYGSVVNYAGDAADGVLVYIETVGGIISVRTDSNGNFVANLGDIYNYTAVTNDDIYITVQGAWQGYNDTAAFLVASSPQDLTPTDPIPLNDPAPQIIISKVANVTSASAGETVTYTIYYNNTGFGTASDVWVNDTLPAGVIYISDTSGLAEGVGKDTSGNPLWFHFTSVAPGEYSFEIVVEMEFNGVKVNVAEVEYTNATGVPMPSNSDNATVTVMGAPLAPYYVYGFAFDDLGAPVTDAWVNITNNNTGASYNVSVDANGFYMILFQNGEAFSGDEMYIVGGNATAIGINATVAAAPGNWLNVTLYDITGVEIFKSVDTATTFPGDTFTYTIYFNLTGPIAHLWINDTLDADLLYISDDASVIPTNVGQTYTWYFQNVLAGNYSFNVTVEYNGTLGTRTIPNTATAEWDGNTVESNYANVTVLGAPGPVFYVYGFCVNSLLDPVIDATVNLTIDWGTGVAYWEGPVDANGFYLAMFS
ncbi:MAG: hypothetical protein QCI38_02280, partial [Candidatus Thermoplasmatota archaeon]|nr:hypothetical protein [Candidatus Thermoplasmatota archaeon]